MATSDAERIARLCDAMRAASLSLIVFDASMRDVAWLMRKFGIAYSQMVKFESGNAKREDGDG